MIFYFTGTGNSEFVARELLTDGEELISIADSLKSGKHSFTVPEGEPVGLVFPVYFYTVPTIIRRFINSLELKNASYIYSVITCGGSISQTGSVLKKLLAAKGLRLSYVTSVLMPDNCMFYYQIPGMEGAEQRINAAREQCREISADISSRKEMNIGSSTVLSDLIGLGYKACSSTKKFYADDSCVSCGLCANSCPEQAISMTDGRPVWTKDRCTKCAACINRCHVSAIQYGRGTSKRNRYVNPYVKR